MTTIPKAVKEYSPPMPSPRIANSTTVLNAIHLEFEVRPGGPQFVQPGGRLSCARLLPPCLTAPN